MAYLTIDFTLSKFSYLLYFFSFIYLLVLYAYIAKYQKITWEYPIIILCSFIGMIIILRSTDLFIWFLAIELQSFSFYTLAAYRTNKSYLQTEAGLKYFIFGSIASSYIYLGFLYFTSLREQ
jgi:NADH-quinone oxidoreductase subunit N